MPATKNRQAGIFSRFGGWHLLPLHFRERPLRRFFENSADLRLPRLAVLVQAVLLHHSLRGCGGTEPLLHQSRTLTEHRLLEIDIPNLLPRQLHTLAHQLVAFVGSARSLPHRRQLPEYLRVSLVHRDFDAIERNQVCPQLLVLPCTNFLLSRDLHQPSFDIALPAALEVQVLRPLLQHLARASVQLQPVLPRNLANLVADIHATQQPILQIPRQKLHAQRPTVCLRSPCSSPELLPPQSCDPLSLVPLRLLRWRQLATIARPHSTRCQRAGFRMEDQPLPGRRVDIPRPATPSRRPLGLARSPRRFLRSLLRHARALPRHPVFSAARAARPQLAGA